MDIILLEEISDKLALMESNLSNKLSKEISNSISNVNNVSNQLNALDKKYNDIYIRDFSNTYISSHFDNGTSSDNTPKQSLSYYTEVETKTIKLPFREERKIENLYGNGYVDLVAGISYSTVLHSYNGSRFDSFYDRTVNCSIYINNQFYKTQVANGGGHYFTNIPIKQGDLISIVYSIDSIYQDLSYNFANTSTLKFKNIGIYYETYQNKADFFAKKA